MKELTTLKGKVILVTGAARGLGAILVATDVNAPLLEESVANILAAGGKIASYAMNVTDETSVEETLQSVIEEHGRIDAVINNAGIDYTKSIEELSYDEWRSVIDVNLTGPFIVTKAVYPYMKKQGSGHIINITSTACKRAWGRSTRSSTMNASWP